MKRDLSGLTLPELEALRRKLGADIHDICSQLAVRKGDPQPEAGSKAYAQLQAWRTGALHARRMMEAERAEVKARIGELSAQVARDEDATPVERMLAIGRDLLVALGRVQSVTRAWADGGMSDEDAMHEVADALGFYEDEEEQ